MTTRSRRRISARPLRPLLLGAALSCGFGPARAEAPRPPAPEPTEITLGIAIPSYVHAVAWLAADKGFFERAGLDVKVMVMGGSAATMKGLVSGDLDIGLAGGDAVIKADLAGADLRVFGGVVNRFYHRLVGAKGVTSAAQLKGGSVGLPFLGGPQDMAVQFALAELGLAYHDDVEIRSMGKEYARLVALDRGLVDAVTSAAPPGLLREMGLNLLVDLPASERPFPYMMMVARQGTLRDRRGMVTRFVEALVPAMHDYARDREGSLAALADRLGADKGAPGEAYAACGPSLYSFPPYPDPRGMQVVLDFMAKLEDRDLARAGEHQAAEFIDTGILDELKARGFFEGAAKPPQ